MPKPESKDIAPHRSPVRASTIAIGAGALLVVCTSIWFAATFSEVARRIVPGGFSSSPARDGSNAVLVVALDLYDGKKARWELRMDAAYVEAMHRSPVRTEPNLYAIRFMLDTWEPSSRIQWKPMEERVDDIFVWLHGPIQTDRASVIEALKRRLQVTCALESKGEDGLAVYAAVPSAPQSETPCFIRSSSSSRLFVAPDERGEPDFTFDCEFAPKGSDRCRTQLFAFKGWAAQPLFHRSNVRKWKTIAEQVRRFLDQHTVSITQSQ